MKTSDILLKREIEQKVIELAGYDVKTLQKRVNLGAYDALMILQDIKDMASGKFFNKQFGIQPHDFKRKCSKA